MTAPAYYDEAKVGRLVAPDIAAATAAGLAAGLPPAAEDKQRVLLLLIDAQVDFIHEDGALSVPGAVEDTRRTVAWIYRNAAKISAIAASLDSHIPLQIFFPTWWADREGHHPEPFTAITTEQVEEGNWTPLYEPEWSRHYVRRLEEQAKKQLMIWPFHTLMGTPGHALTPALYEAIAFHAAARRARPRFLIKGTLPKTEFYSILEPEVKDPEDPEAELNEAFLEELLSYDAVYLAGQAKSHCVLETVTSIMRRVGDRRELAEKFHLLTDCTSSVAHPEVDFEALAQAAYAEFSGRGLQLVTSAMPLD